MSPEGKWIVCTLTSIDVIQVRISCRGLYCRGIPVPVFSGCLKSRSERFMLLATFFGVVMGLVLGLTGAGGGILAVPALVLGLGWSMTQAAPVALFAVGSAAAVGAIDGLRHGLVRYRAALLIALLGALFSPLGIYFAHRLPEKVLMILFSLLMVIV